MSTLKLGSWCHIRGFAEPIRYLLLYCDVPFEDYRFTFGNTGPTDIRKMFLLKRFQLNFDFPSFPFLIDGQCKITKVMFSFVVFCLYNKLIHFVFAEHSNFKIPCPKVRSVCSKH